MDGVAEPRLKAVVVGGGLFAGVEREASGELAGMTEGFEQWCGEAFPAFSGDGDGDAIALWGCVRGEVFDGEEDFVADVEGFDGFVVGAVGECGACWDEETGLVGVGFSFDGVTYRDDVLSVQVEDGDDVCEGLFLAIGGVAAGDEGAGIAGFEDGGGGRVFVSELHKHLADEATGIECGVGARFAIGLGSGHFCDGADDVEGGAP